jgi:hypothetical protein
MELIRFRYNWQPSKSNLGPSEMCGNFDICMMGVKRKAASGHIS